jgi:hypothetical protein
MCCLVLVWFQQQVVAPVPMALASAPWVVAPALAYVEVREATKF